MLSVKDGDVNKLGVLFNKYSKGLYNYFKYQIKDSAKSEDLVQNVFYSILRYRHTYIEGADFKVWMYSIARNEKIRFFRSNKMMTSEIDPQHADDNLASPEKRLEIKSEMDCLTTALNLISKDNREIIILSRFNGLSYSSIAEICECSVGALKVRMFRALKELREKFQELSGGCYDKM
jgi:RNA polymerase sigma-70 factor (ECF subfamily)